MVNVAVVVFVIVFFVAITHCCKNDSSSWFNNQILSARSNCGCSYENYRIMALGNELAKILKGISSELYTYLISKFTKEKTLVAVDPVLQALCN